MKLVTAIVKPFKLEAVKTALASLRGAYAIAVFCKDEPHRLIGARAGSPLILGVGADGQSNYLASDAMALAGVTDQIVYLEEGDVVDVQLGKQGHGWNASPSVVASSPLCQQKNDNMSAHSATRMAVGLPAP